MNVAVQPLFAFDNSFVRDLEGLFQPWRATPARAPQLLVLNEELAAESVTVTNAFPVSAPAVKAPVVEWIDPVPDVTEKV